MQRVRVACVGPPSNQKLFFYHIVRSIAPSSSYCDGTWWLWCGNTMPMIFYFLPLFFLFSTWNSVSHAKFQCCLLIYWDFEFGSFFKKKFLFLDFLLNFDFFFQLYHSILICDILFFSICSSFLLLFFFYHFVKSFFLFNLTIQ